MFKKILLVFTALVLSIGLFAQTATFKGKVLDKETNEPVPYTAVTVISSEDLSQIGGTAEDIEKMPGRTVLEVASTVEGLATRGTRTGKTKPGLEGSWRLVYSQRITNGLVDFNYPEDMPGHGIKIWSGSHYSFVNSWAPR